MILKTTRNECINIEQVKVFELQADNVLLIKDGQTTRKFTLTEASKNALEDYIATHSEDYIE